MAAGGLGEALGAVIELWGADRWGVADLGPAREYIAAQGGEAVADYPRAVSVGIALPGSDVCGLCVYVCPHGRGRG